MSIRGAVKKAAKKAGRKVGGGAKKAMKKVGTKVGEATPGYGSYAKTIKGLVREGKDGKKKK